jgi:hypothetical protein
MRLSDFLNLRPICDGKFLQVVWIAYLVVEVASNLNLLWGTLQVWSGGGTLQTVAWVLVRIVLVRIFLEMAARIIVPRD